MANNIDEFGLDDLDSALHHSCERDDLELGAIRRRVAHFGDVRSEGGIGRRMVAVVDEGDELARMSQQEVAHLGTNEEVVIWRSVELVRKGAKQAGAVSKTYHEWKAYMKSGRRHRCQ